MYTDPNQEARDKADNNRKTVLTHLAFWSSLDSARNQPTSIFGSDEPTQVREFGKSHKESWLTYLLVIGLPVAFTLSHYWPAIESYFNRPKDIAPTQNASMLFELKESTPGPFEPTHQMFAQAKKEVQKLFENYTSKMSPTQLAKDAARSEKSPYRDIQLSQLIGVEGNPDSPYIDTRYKIYPLQLPYDMGKHPADAKKDPHNPKAVIINRPTTQGVITTRLNPREVNYKLLADMNPTISGLDKADDSDNGYLIRADFALPVYSLEHALMNICGAPQGMYDSNRVKTACGYMKNLMSYQPRNVAELIEHNKAYYTQVEIAALAIVHKDGGITLFGNDGKVMKHVGSTSMATP